LKEFSCIGGVCEDNCCVGRQVYVDKKTFLKYRRVEDETLAPMFEKCVKRERDDERKSDETYAKIRMLDKSCPFHDGQKLCAIQSKLGRDYLCNACDAYPRVYKMVDRKLERCGTMACPEIVRAALGKPEGIALESVEEVGRVPSRAPSLDTRLTKYAATPVKFFWDIRIFCLTLLQNRTYALGKRLILIGILYKKIEALDKADNVEGIPAMLELFSNEVENEAFSSELDQIENNSEMQMILARMLTDKQLGSSLTDAGKYLQCVVETLSGLQIVEGGLIEDSLKTYVKNRDTYVAEYLKEKEYVLENFLVNEFFTQLMPFEAGETIWNSYLNLCVTYSIVKLHLNGMAGYHKGLDDKTVFRLIQAFSKVTQYNRSLVMNVVTQLKDVERDTLAWMTILVNG
jgi:lysine-N-methylase